MIVIHHGANNFDKTKWKNITNITFNNKPNGGLWTSPKDSNMSWYDWCEREDFSTGDNSLSFEIDLKDFTLLRIDSVNDFKDEYRVTEYDEFGLVESDYVDYEKIAKDYDCLFVTEKAIKESRYGFIDFNFCGWDCETVIIMNIEILKEN